MPAAVHQSVVTSVQDLEGLPLARAQFCQYRLSCSRNRTRSNLPTRPRHGSQRFRSGGSSGLNNELSVDGGDNSDDYIGGFLQNFSPDAIQEFAIRTAQEDADYRGTTCWFGRSSRPRAAPNDWHGDVGVSMSARQALNARFPIENPAPNPKQPFSRQNYVGTHPVEPIEKNHCLGTFVV